jgi:hypothetical protein
MSGCKNSLERSLTPDVIGKESKSLGLYQMRHKSQGRYKTKVYKADGKNLKNQRESVHH